MIKISDEFSCERDHHGWKLIETYDAKEKVKGKYTGETVKRQREWFYPTMASTMRAVMDKSLGGCANAEGILKTIHETTKKIDAACRKEFEC